MSGTERGADREFDHAVRVILPERFAEVAGAVLMDLLGPFELETGGLAAAGAADGIAWARGAAPAPGPPAGDADRLVTLVFYPEAGAASTLDDVLTALPEEVRDSGRVSLETLEVSRDWVEGWRDHFHPIVVGGVRIRPPWEAPPEGSAPVGPALGGAASGAAPDGAIAGGAPSGAAFEGGAPIDVVINPGLGFGTGLHPTTRGTLQLLQLTLPRGKAQRRRAAQRRDAVRRGESLVGGPRGPLVDAGTGSGILAITAAKSGWGPVIAFDNDPVALVSARENVEANGVQGMVEVHEVDIDGASPEWFAGATVLANMTLDPVLSLVRKLGSELVRMGGEATVSDAIQQGATQPGAAAPAAMAPRRIVVSGILAGAQEYEVIRVAAECGFVPGQRLYETEWVSVELLPRPANGPPVRGLPVGGSSSGGSSAGGDSVGGAS